MSLVALIAPWSWLTVHSTASLSATPIWFVG